MYDFSEAEIISIVVHNIGNKHEGENLILSQDCLRNIDESILNILHTYFLSPFKKDAFYNFDSERLEENTVYACVDNIFLNRECFYQESLKIARQLYEFSNHPNIKSGEFYLVYFKSCRFFDEICDAIGIFKSENKDTYIKIFMNDKKYQVDYESGINIHKLDKGCIIFNTQQENGYRATIVDKVNSKNNAVYWQEDFLGVKPLDDSYFNTKKYLDLCKGFVDNVYNKENEVEIADQIDMLNRSIDFFKDTKKFSEDKFKERVIIDPNVITAFEDYKEIVKEENEIEINDNFKVSNFAVNDQKRYFRHVLKLDKNFHVYIHGERRLLEKGYDTAKDMNYYKLFYKEEN